MILKELMDRYIKTDEGIYDNKKNEIITINEVIRRLNLMDNRIKIQQERLKDFQEALEDETGIKFSI